MNKINVVYTVDIQGPGSFQFMDQLIVSIKSIKFSKSEDEDISVYVLYGNISTDFALSLTNLSTDGFKVILKPIGRDTLGLLQQFTKQSPMSQGRSWSGIVFARLYIPLIVPEIDKALYIDSDTLIRSPLSELYSFDLKDKMLGMVMGIVPEYGYNSGVILMDCKKIRETENLYRDLESHMKQFARTYKLPDQTVINRFFGNNLGQIETIPGIEWNYPPMPREIGSDRKMMMEKAKIWHFYNQFAKPIRYDDQDLARFEWQKILEK